MSVDAASLLLPSGPTLIDRPPDLLPAFTPSARGGLFAGTYPGGITSVEGVPTSATVLVRVRHPGRTVDGALVSSTQSDGAGSWELDNVDPDALYDVVARKAGERDVVQSGVAPLSAPYIATQGLLFLRDEARSQFLTAKRGVPPYEYSIESGTLPTGLSLDTDTGEISGTATVAGTTVVVFGVVDSRTSTPVEQEVFFRVVALA